ncbi:MAG: hypothetical protein K2G52_09725 [Muribaculaceae bacterium]|nr:hypothetical protein [Muribaculaceae bacterium]
MKRFILIICILIPLINSYADVNIKGKVSDLDGTPLQGIMMRLYQGDKIKAFTNSRRDGTFLLKTDSIPLPAKISFASKNYAPSEIWIDNTSDSVFAILEPQQFMLQEVVVKVPHARLKGDTITYDVASYTNPSDRSIEDVIKKLPGIEVTENGTIIYDGEPINNFYIEGLNLMGNNYAVASQNISPGDISSISIYERHQSKKALKGISNTKSAALNLKLKKGRMLKPVGYANAGAGYGDGLLWTGQIYSMLISPSNQTIISAQGNNTGKNYINSDRKTSSPNPASSTFSMTPFGTPKIATQRYINNKSAYFTANSIFKLKDDLTFTVNSSYGLDHDGFDGASLTEYLASGRNDLLYEEKVDNSIKKHIVSASAKIEQNSDKIYIKDQFDFNGSFNHNDYGIVNSSAINQNLRNRNFNFSNDFNIIIRKGENVVNIKSETQYRNTPLSTISAYDPLAGTSSMYQNVEGKSFHNRETTGFSRKISRKSSVGTDITFQADYDSFLSYGIKSEDSPQCNDLSGHNIAASASPFYKYLMGRHSIILTIPIEWINLKYTDIVNEATHRFNKIYINGDLDIFIKMNQFNWLSLNAAWRHSTGDIRNFIENPVFTTFRSSRTLGNGALMQTLSKSASASYTHRNPIESFYLRGVFSFSRKESNYLSVYNVDQSGTSNSSLNSDTHTDISNLMINASKSINRIATRVSLNLTGVWIQRESMRSSSLIDISNSTYIATLSGETRQWNDRLSLSANISYSISHQSFGGAIPSNDLSELSFNGKISLFPMKKLEIYSRIFFNRSQLEENNFKSNLFIDAGIKYSVKKFDIELTACNLTDMRRYEYTLYQSLDLSTYSYSLRPMEAILSLRYNF